MHSRFSHVYIRNGFYTESMWLEYSGGTVYVRRTRPHVSQQCTCTFWTVGTTHMWLHRPVKVKYQLPRSRMEVPSSNISMQNHPSWTGTGFQTLTFGVPLTWQPTSVIFVGNHVRYGLGDTWSKRNSRSDNDQEADNVDTLWSIVPTSSS